jgi:hypothetical protein
MPLYKLLTEMPYDEMQGWMSYLERRPVGWREDDRTLKLLQVQGFKGKGESIFSSLDALAKDMRTRKLAHDAELKAGQISTANLKGSYLFQKLMSATGGDQIPL